MRHVLSLACKDGERVCFPPRSCKDPVRLPPAPSPPASASSSRQELRAVPSARCFEGSCTLAGCLGRAGTRVGAKVSVSGQGQAPGLTGVMVDRARGALLLGASLVRFVELFGTLQSAVLLSCCKAQAREKEGFGAHVCLRVISSLSAVVLPAPLAMLSEAGCLDQAHHAGQQM